MRWFRFYTEVVHDPKVQRLSAPIFRAWVNLLCLASENGGCLPPEGDVAFGLRLSLPAARRLLAELEAGGLLDREGDCLRPHNWAGRQFASDDSAPRVQRLRQRRGNAGVTASVTPVQRPSAATVTADVTPPETDTETETEQRQRQGEEGHTLANGWRAPVAAPPPPAARRPNAISMYEQAFGVPISNQVIADRVTQAEAEYGPECLTHSLEAAAVADVRDWRYVEKIMQRHRRDGCEGRGPPPNGRDPPGGSIAHPVTDDLVDRLQRRAQRGRKAAKA